MIIIIQVDKLKARTEIFSMQAERLQAKCDKALPDLRSSLTRKRL